MRALIIDHDPHACRHLRLLLQRTPAIQVIGEDHTMTTAVTALARKDHDVVFLDVQLARGSSFEIVPLVRPEAAIIFITARDDQAVRAFEVNAVDYILKPVTAARLADSLRRLERARKGRRAAARKFKASDRIFLRGRAAGGRFVPMAEIVAIVSSENYSEVLLADGERCLIRKTMALWEKSLPPEIFMRVRRTTIVNLQRIERIDRNAAENTTLRLHGAAQVFPVGRRVWPKLKARLERHRGA